jgi:hypothetical protein
MVADASEGASNAVETGTSAFALRADAWEIFPDACAALTATFDRIAPERGVPLMSRYALILFFCCNLSAWGQTAPEWKPAAGPLFTEWGKKVDPAKVLPEHPRPQMMGRPWMSLNGIWSYAIARKNAGSGAWPITGAVLVPFPIESALSGVMRRLEPDQMIHYSRNFVLPDTFKEKRTLLHFGAVDWETTVSVNGKKVGEHRGGYDPFTFDITDALKPSGLQELEVVVSDPTDKGTQPRGKQVSKPSGIYYTPTSGIWQTVWLEAVPEIVSIHQIKILPDVDRNQVSIRVYTGTTLGNLLVRATISDRDNVITSKTGIHNAELVLAINNPKLWSPDSPYLYDLKVELLHDTPIDTVQSYFGMRKISIGKDPQGRTVILLNNKPLFQVGLLDQGFWPDGLYTAPTDEALKFDIEQTKRLGFNVIRKHVKVEPDRWYYWCDKLGMLVWQDMPSGDKSVAPNKPDLVRSPESAQIYQTELKSMIDHLQPHPSIIMWVVFNEGWGQFDTKRITEWTKQYDPTRLVNCASGWNDHAGIGDVHDIHVYPGPGAPPLEEKRAIVLGEFGGLGLKIDGHTWEQRTWGYRRATDRGDLTRKYERLLAQAWSLHREKGLSACIYTQTTDVETEANGILTYDRAVLKMDADRMKAVNEGRTDQILIPISVVPSSEKQGQVYRFTLTKPEGEWFKPGFDDSSWKEGPGGFGTRGTPGAIVRTEWKTDDIWLRREVMIPEGKTWKSPHLWLHHDEDAEVYLNGVLAAKVSGFITGYEEVPISKEAAGTLKPGKNLIAIHCHQTTGGQYIDVGLVDFK